LKQFMTRLHYSNLFVMQSTWIRLLILIIGSLAAIGVPSKALIYVFTTAIVYFLASPVIFKSLISGLKAILPFLAAYSLFATILGLDIQVILIMIFRIAILMILLSFFTASMNLHRFMEDAQILKKRSIFVIVLYFSLATLLYLKQLSSYYKSESIRISSEQKKLNPISGIIDAIHYNWLEKDKIQKETSTGIPEPCQHLGMLIRHNSNPDFIFVTA
jgi:hypothetical protein